MSQSATPVLNRWIVQWLDHDAVSVSVSSFESFDDAQEFAARIRETAAFVFEPVLMIGGVTEL